MNIRINTSFKFRIAGISYSSNGEICITLSSDELPQQESRHYSTVVNSGDVETNKTVSLLEYARTFAGNSMIQEKTKDSYRLMCNHLESYGDKPLEMVTTDYLQGFISHLQSTGIKTGTVRLYFQKLACVLHDAYKNCLFDDRVLQRVRRPKREQEKRCFLSETELKKLVRHKLPDNCDNVRKMFLFSCLTGLRYSDVQGLKWKDLKSSGSHIILEFRQQKTDTCERLPLCAEAETLLRKLKRKGEKVFREETNQRVNVVLKKWCREAKVKKTVSFHIARHTFCVLLLTKDVPIYTVQRLMCHSDIGTTKIYADLLNRSKSKALKRLPTLGVAC